MCEREKRKFMWFDSGIKQRGDVVRGADRASGSGKTRGEGHHQHGTRLSSWPHWGHAHSNNGVDQERGSNSNVKESSRIPRKRHPSMQLCNRPEETSRRKGNGSLQKERYQERELTDFQYDQPGGKVYCEPVRDTGRTASPTRMENTKEMKTTKKPRHIDTQYRWHMES